MLTKFTTQPCNIQNHFYSFLEILITKEKCNIWITTRMTTFISSEAPLNFKKDIQ